MQDFDDSSDVYASDDDSESSTSIRSEPDNPLLSPDDEDDFRLVKACRHPQVRHRGMAMTIIRIKHNDPLVKSLTVTRKDYFDEFVWRRLGIFLGRNTAVEELYVRDPYDHRCVPEMCNAGLQHNRNIRELTLTEVDLRDAEGMGSLASFLCRNPLLKRCTLRQCHLGQASVNILSNALSNRCCDTLEMLDLNYNHLGHLNLDELALALTRSRNFRKLYLSDNGIGRVGCTSLANLLRNPDSNIESLDLGKNNLDDESAIVLAESLATNTRLECLYLTENYQIAAAGWSALRKLVCDDASINSVAECNHTLCNIGIPLYAQKDIDAIHRAMGADNAHLMFASLTINLRADAALAMRHKMLWSHVRGTLNLGDSPIDMCAMTRILAWLGGGSNTNNESTANLIHYRRPPLPKSTMDTIRLDSIHRILKSMPDLCQANESEKLLTTKRKLDDSGSG